MASGEQFARVARAARPHVLVWLAYAALSVIFTWPLTAHLGTVLPGEPADAQIFVWDEWLFRHSLFHGGPIFWTNLAFHPWGAALSFHTYAPLNGHLGIPLAPLFGDLRTHNLLILWSWATAGWGAFLFAKRFATRTLPCFFAGFAFAFCPYRFAHLLGHINLTSTQWLPLFAFAWVSVFESKTPRQAARWGMLAGAMLCANLYTELTYVLFAAIIAAIFGGFGLAHRRPRRVLAAGLGAFATSAVLLAIPFLLSLEYISRADLAAPPHFGAEIWSASFWAYFLPGPQHPMFGARVRALAGLPDFAESAVFPGYAVWLLGVAGFAIVRRKTVLQNWLAPALALAVFGFLVSLGPTLHVGAHRLWMPYRTLSSLPFLKNARVPSRFSLLTVLALATSSAAGLERLLERRSRAYRHAITAGAFIVSSFDFAIIPYPTFEVEDPPSLHALGRLPPGAALRLPVGARSASAQWGYFGADSLIEQSVHEKPYFGGMIARISDARMEEAHNMPIVREEVELQSERAPRDPISPEAARAFAKQVGMRYVIVEGDHIASQSEWFLRERLPLVDVASEKRYAIYRVLDEPGETGHFEPGDGWDAEERNGFGVAYRWMGLHSRGVIAGELGTGPSWCVRIAGWSGLHHPEAVQLSVRIDDGPPVTTTSPPEGRFHRIFSAPRPAGATRVVLSIDSSDAVRVNDDRKISINYSIISARPFTPGDDSCTPTQ